MTQSTRRFTYSLICALFFLLAVISLDSRPCEARAVELVGIIHYDLPSLNQVPPTFVSSSGGVGYAFYGRLELGPGMVESGFLWAPMSITTSELAVNTKFAGSFWTIPVLYRYTFFEPYLSLGLGMDYAIAGSTNITTPTGQISTSQGDTFASHFGAIASLEVKQDLGENLSIVLDVRYRMALGTGINYYSTSTQTSTAINTSFYSIGLGLMKHLEY